MSTTTNSDTHTPPQPSAAGPTLPSAASPSSAGGPPSPSAAEIAALAGAENFPVALKLLRQPLRDDLLRLYGFARLVDNIGDDHGNSVAGRLAMLNQLEQELQQTYRGEPTTEIFQQLLPTVRRCDLSQAEFVKLIDANRLDQTKSRYATWSELMAYCELSANPVGRLVLEIFDSSSAENIVLSDAVCSALQVVEHLQDVGEDFAAGRIYLPADSLIRHGYAESDLAVDVSRARASSALRQVVCDLAKQARQQLVSGEPLVRALKGRRRLAIAGFIAGGHAALDAVEAAGGEVLSKLRQPRKPDFVRHFIRLLWRAATGWPKVA